MTCNTEISDKGVDAATAGRFGDGRESRVKSRDETAVELSHARELVLLVGTGQWCDLGPSFSIACLLCLFAGCPLLAALLCCPPTCSLFTYEFLDFFPFLLPLLLALS